MSDGFRVDAGALDAHAQQVDAVVERVRLAAAAGRPLGRHAYGIVGQVFAVAAAGATRSGSVAVARVAGSAAGLADGVRATRDDYVRAEQRNAAGFPGLR